MANSDTKRVGARIFQDKPAQAYPQTPIRNKSGSRNTNIKMTAGEEHAISAQHTKEKGMSAAAEMMLKNLMPVEEEVLELLLAHCEQNGLYRDGRWTNMPRSTKDHEKSMYGPVRVIGQCIHDAIQDEVKIDGSLRNLKKIQYGERYEHVALVKGVWNVLPDRTPRSIDRYGADTRPDIDFAIPSADRAQLSEDIDQYLENLEGRPVVST